MAIYNKKHFSYFYTSLYFFILFTINTKVIAKEQNLPVNNYLNTINYDWWQNFNDSNLEKYILKGLLNNSDLKILNLKLKQYEEFVKYTFGEELPTVSTSLLYSDMKDIPFGNGQADGNGILLPLSVSYELDLFGKNRNKTKSVKKQLEIYAYQLQSSYISYVSNLSTVYFNLVRFNEILYSYDELIVIQEKLLNDKLTNYKYGLVNQIDINKYKQNLENIRSERIKILRDRDNLLTQFSVMLGETPANAKNFKIADFDDIYFSGNIGLLISSDIIFSRPDVLAQEKQLEKSKIDISIARKEFLPTFSINGSLVFNNMASGGFFSSANTIKGLVAGMSQPLFLGGKLKSNLKIQKTKYLEMLEEYKKITLQAIKEINDSLINVVYGESVVNMKYKNFIHTTDDYNNYKIQYKNGLISYDDLLQIKQKLISNRIELVNSKIESYIDYISLYKATAGFVNNNMEKL